MTIRFARILLFLAALANLVLALSLPTPGKATLAQQATLVLVVMCLILCAVAFVQLRRRPGSGRRLAFAGGILGVGLILWRGGVLVQMMREGSQAQALSALLPLGTWIAQTVAAALLLSQEQAILESDPMR